jgi:hypothetical protein
MAILLLPRISHVSEQSDNSDNSDQNPPERLEFRLSYAKADQFLDAPEIRGLNGVWRRNLVQGQPARLHVAS